MDFVFIPMLGGRRGVSPAAANTSLLASIVSRAALPTIPELGGTLRGAAVAITHDAQRITR